MRGSSQLRQRGYTPAALRDFCERIGVAKADNLVDIAHIEHCLREDLTSASARRVAVLRPLAALMARRRRPGRRSGFRPGEA